MLVYNDERNNDLLGNLRTHFNQDFVFYRFLSSANGTAVSFFNLFLKVHLWHSQMVNIKTHL